MPINVCLVQLSNGAKPSLYDAPTLAWQEVDRLVIILPTTEVLILCEGIDAHQERAFH